MQKSAPGPQAHILMIKHGENVSALDEESKTSMQMPPQEIPSTIKAGNIKV